EDFIRACMGEYASLFDSFNGTERLILLFDALNEMPAEKLPALLAYLRTAPRWVLSCRVRDYQTQLKSFTDIAEIHLQALTPPRIRDLVTSYFHDDSARGEALWQAMHGSDDLLALWAYYVQHGQAEFFWTPHTVKLPTHLRAVANAFYGDRRKLMALCRNPYMARVTCQMYANDGELPANRGR